MNYTRESLSALLSMLAHDLRAPLAHARVFSEILKSDLRNLTPDQLDLLTRIVSSIAQAINIVDSVGQLSRISHLELELELVDLNEVLRRVLERLRERVTEKSLVLVLEVLPTIRANIFCMESVVYNVLDNAIRYSSLLGIISVKWSNNSLLIRDQGPGVSEQYLTTIFEMFTKFNSKQGSGMGLGIVQHVMRSLGGSASAHNTTPNGLEVVLSFKQDAIENTSS